MRFIPRAIVALAMTCSCALANADGTILLTRPVHNGGLAAVGTGLFSVDVEPSPYSTTDATWASEVHIVDVNTGRDKLVTHGFAVSWYQP